MKSLGFVRTKMPLVEAFGRALMRGHWGQSLQPSCKGRL